MITLLFSALLAISTAALPIQENPEPGKWCSDYHAALSYAHTESIPLVVMWGRANCEHCTAMKTAVQEPDFVEWQRDYSILYTYVASTDAAADEAMDFVLSPNNLKTLPAIALYWMRKDGTVTKVNFSGVSGMMPVKSGLLQQQLMRSIASTFIDYWGYDPTLPKIPPSFELSQLVACNLELPQLAGFKVKGLPSGLKFDSKTGTISGFPKKSGTSTVTFTQKGLGSLSTTFKVSECSFGRENAFNGFIYGNESDYPLGTIAVSMTTSGKVTAKVEVASGNLVFTSKCWDDVQDGIYFVDMAARNGELLSLEFDSSSRWDEDGIEGMFIDANGNEFMVYASRYAYNRDADAIAALAPYVSIRTFDAVAGDAGYWYFDAPYDVKKPDIKVAVGKNGKIKISGKIGDYKINVQSYVCMYDQYDSELMLSTTAVDLAGVSCISCQPYKRGIVIACGVAFVRIGGERRALCIQVDLWPSQYGEWDSGVAILHDFHQ